MATETGSGAPDTPALLERYLRLTGEALERVRPGAPRRSFLSGASEDFLSMARAYLSDAQHFRERGDTARALAAVSYAHGWIDAGVRLGILDGGEDDVRFTPFH
ncbi:MAG TPA: DUF357 domain-containing protein [Thermoplasmata archaeon]|nr:DUF357 domain-containing protein [Thermoplasmata archaeon]